MRPDRTYRSGSSRSLWRRPVAGLSVAGLVVAGILWGWGTPVAAHGVGGRNDLGIGVWKLAWGASFAVLFSFVALSWFWATPRLRAAAVGRPLPTFLQGLGRWLAVPARLAGILAFLVVLVAALWGNTNPSVNIAPVAVFIIFWIGMPVFSMLLGDVWRGLDPLRTLAELAARVRAGFRPSSPGRVTGSGPSGGRPSASRAAAAGGAAPGAGHGWAVAGIFSFTWFELAYHSPSSPRSIAVYLLVYSLVMLAGAACLGRGWLRNAEAFGTLFRYFAAMAVFFVDGNGNWRRRPPLAGLAKLVTGPASVLFILVVLGSTSFDGFTRSSLWLDVISNRSGWEYTLVSSVGLVFVVAVVTAVYRGAVALMARITGDDERELATALAPSLIPIAAAYLIAHYFSLLVLEGQATLAHLSDPFGQGWDLFGTADRQVDYSVISPTAIAWVQTVTIAVGHVLAVTAAHDRAVERYPQHLAVRSQYPMLVAVIIYTVGGLFLLLGN